MKLIRHIAFLAGSLSVTAIFIALNIRSYQIETNKYYEVNGLSHFGGTHSGFSWGFPIASFYEGTCFPCGGLSEYLAFAINVFIWVFTAFVAGYVLKLIVEKNMDSFRHPSFLVGVCGTIFFWFFMNVRSAMMNRYNPNGSVRICFDCYETYGFPFLMHESGTIAHLDQYIWSGVIANIAVAVLSSIIVGWLVAQAYLFVRNQSKQLR
ncbi:MAG: hypothetical protein KF685_05205 [Acidobacteria bacterium]|nr:hypothetical protein [Acidobacteriota bacterium]